MIYGADQGCTGILFQETISSAMPDCAVADLSPAPGYCLGPQATLDAWTSGWPDGGPQWVAQPTESQIGFRERIIADLQAAGNVGQVVCEYSRAGFWGRNANGTVIS